MKKFYKYLGGLVVGIGLSLSLGLSATFAQQPRVDMLDISHHNGDLPLSFFQTIKASAGVNAVVVKVSEGQSFYDKSASVNIANAKAAGMIAHAYHYARFTSIDSATAEARFFDAMLQKSGFDRNNDGNVVVDIEENSLTTNEYDLTNYTNEFIKEMYKLGYSKVDIYSGSYYYNSRLQPQNLFIKNPWLASYPYVADINNITAKFTNGIGSWQWSSSYQFKGLEQFGKFDVSMDIYGKYTMGVMNSTIEVKQIGNVSLVNYMKEKGMDASFANRSKLAEEYGIVDYNGTAAQNLALLSKLQSGVKPSDTPLPIVQPKAIVPTPAPKVVQSQGTYRVVSGDSLSKIAKKFGMNVNTLANLNGIKNVNRIYTGQILKISSIAKVTVQPKATVQKAQYHIVRKNETVSELAHQFGSSIYQIKVWNGLNSKYVIYPNQRLKVK